MWAMIPMLRVRESGNSRIASPPLAPLAFRSTAVSVTTISSFHSCGSAGAQLGTPTSSSASPAVMGEGLVGLGHLVGVLLTLDRGAGAGGGVQQLTGLAFWTARLTVVTGSLPVLRRHCSRAEYTPRSDSERLPLSMILLTSWVTSCDW